MNLEPLFHAPFAVQIHVATVVPAAFLGAFLLAARKGTPAHRMLGKIWLGLMVASALSSFFIHDLRMVGPFSPIHLISIYVLWSATVVYRSARAGRIAEHRRAVTGLYLGGIVGAGVFTLLPRRLMGQIFLQDLTGMLMLGLIVGTLLLGFLSVRQLNRRMVSR